MITTSTKHKTSVTAADGSIEVTWGKDLVWNRKEVTKTSTEHRNLCYSSRWLHRGNMGKGFGMEQKGSDTTEHRNIC
jgi:hypothetical protein